MSMMKRLEQANSIPCSSFYKFGFIKKDAHGFGICNMALDVTVG